MLCTSKTESLLLSVVGVDCLLFSARFDRCGVSQVDGLGGIESASYWVQCKSEWNEWGVMSDDEDREKDEVRFGREMSLAMRTEMEQIGFPLAGRVRVREREIGRQSDAESEVRCAPRHPAKRYGLHCITPFVSNAGQSVGRASMPLL